MIPLTFVPSFHFTTSTTSTTTLLFFFFFFFSLHKNRYQSGEGFLLVYSITNRSTFEELDEVYKEILMAKDPVPEGGVPVVLVGNKCDLESERSVTKEEGEQLEKGQENVEEKKG